MLIKIAVHRINHFYISLTNQEIIVWAFEIMARNIYLINEVKLCYTSNDRIKNEKCINTIYIDLESY